MNETSTGSGHVRAAAYSIQEFCAAHGGIARTAFYEMMKNGHGPRTFKVGRRTLISLEAAADWRRSMEAENAKGSPT